MRGTRPPEGYQLFVAPKYILKRGKVRVNLGFTMGEVLSILIGSGGDLVTAKEISKTVYSGRSDGGPSTQWKVINVVIFQLKKRLREYGIVLNLDSRKGQHGFRFRGFEECEPAKFETVKKPTRNPDAKTTYQLKKLRPKPPAPKPFLHGRKRTGRPHSTPPKALPPEYVAAQQAPWHFPERLEFSREK